MDILRFITAGSVDDGKSTLIGRLLYDSKSILQDHLDQLRDRSESADGTIDLALLTDGLRAEREQGITIDVAYKYFSTPSRKFIIADTPGHIQYTRNMVTGASTADLMVILVDARTGVIEQTRRHSIIAAMLGIRHIVVAVNKMDMVGFDQRVFEAVCTDYRLLAQQLKLQSVTYIPVSALYGDNIVGRSASMPWYGGMALLPHLEAVQLHEGSTEEGRFAVQYVIRPQTPEWPDYRGYAGRVVSGRFHPGMRIRVEPSGTEATVRGLSLGTQELQEAATAQSVTIELEEDIDVSRGDMFVPATDEVRTTAELAALVCWLDQRPARPGAKYLLQHHGRVVRCALRSIDYLVDVNTLEEIASPEELPMNGIARVQLRTQSPIVADSYAMNRRNGGAVLIDETSLLTVGAVMFGE